MHTENLLSKCLLLKIKIHTRNLAMLATGNLSVCMRVCRSRCLCTNTRTFTSLIQPFWKRAVPPHVLKGRTGTGGARRAVAQPRRAPPLQTQRHQHLPAGPIGPSPAGTSSCSKRLHHPPDCSHRRGTRLGHPCPRTAARVTEGEDSVFGAWDAMTEF